MEFRKIKSKENYEKEEVEQQFSGINSLTSRIEFWGNVKETLLDIPIPTS